MIRSMTAFAGAEHAAENLTCSTEIRSYNSRFLDIVVRMPHGFAGLEERIKNLVKSRLSRGRVEIAVKIQETGEDAVRYEVDGERAKAYYKAILQLKELVGVEGDLSLEHLVANNTFIKPAEAQRDWDVYGDAIDAAIGRALDALVDMRENEGKHLENDFAQRLVFLERVIDHIEKDSEGTTVRYKDRLAERIALLLKDIAEIDHGRIAQEAAVLAERSDISEEVVRAKSHIRQFRVIMASGEPAGRKLNFLLQELNREFNTMGSKTELDIVAHRVVDGKAELEKIREQVQNIE